MAETFCVCCGAEVERDWRLSVSLEELSCSTCSMELEALGEFEDASRLGELEMLETLEYLQRPA